MSPVAAFTQTGEPLDREIESVFREHSRFVYRTAYLNREETRLPISTVILAGQRMPVNEALYTVKTMDKQSVGHPLIEGGQKLLPSVTRVFSASRDMFVYLEAYEKYTTAAMEPLVAYATFYREGTKV